jgi:hypothetical protein
MNSAAVMQTTAQANNSMDNAYHVLSVKHLDKYSFPTHTWHLPNLADFQLSSPKKKSQSYSSPNM